MNNNFLFNEFDNPDFVITPNLGELVQNGAAYTHGEAVMPTKTQVNHIAIVSGAYSENIGIIGNYVFDTTKTNQLFYQNYDFPWKNPDLIKADTVFQSMERENPEYVSAIIAGKNYVGRPLWADLQICPAYSSDLADQLGMHRFPEIQLWDSPDHWVMDNTLLVLKEIDPDITFVNLAFVDPVQHSFGHGSMESWAALAWADYQVGRLLQYLKDSGKLEHTLIVVTADHGQSNTWERIPIDKVLREKGIRAFVVADGAFASIFLNDISDLEKTVNVLNDLDCVDGVWYGDGFDEYKINTPYTGDIAISLRPPYEAFSKIRPPFLGIHGGLQQRFVPIVFYGPHIKRGELFTTASLTDIVPTICQITGYPLPEDSQGESLIEIFDPELSSASDVRVKLVDYPRYNFSFISLLFLVLSILILIPGYMTLRSMNSHVIVVTGGQMNNIIPSMLFALSGVLSIGASFYSYIVNLYRVPGIQSDAILVAMDFGVLGSFLISISLVLLLLWYLPWVVRIVIQRLRRRKLMIKIMPYSLLFLILSQIIFTLINIFINIPYSYAFHIFIFFFFGGLGLTYSHRMYMINKYVEHLRKETIISTFLSGILIASIWFYIMMYLLFPTYLYEYGIQSIY
jgi:predicted AlkP superfamily pyrophosphatase or phosphodiesterase